MTFPPVTVSRERVGVERISRREGRGRPCLQVLGVWGRGVVGVGSVVLLGDVGVPASSGTSGWNGRHFLAVFSFCFAPNGRITFFFGPKQLFEVLVAPEFKRMSETLFGFCYLSSTYSFMF